ncbi:unnamed protein product, partial [Meganyctiphanes norvegica]
METKIHDILSEILKVDALQEALVNLLEVPKVEKDSGRHNNVITELQKVFTEFSEQAAAATAVAQTAAGTTNQDVSQKDGPKTPASSSGGTTEVSTRVQEQGVRTIVALMARQNNPYRANSLATVLQSLLQSNTLYAKVVCTVLLADENLTPDNEVFWMSSFLLVKKIITGVDYKGVREIMKMCLERARLLPVNLRRSQLPLMDALCDVMNLIFDRNSSLLPGYFIVNELLKLYPDYKNWPHWKLASLLTDFVDKFRRAAQMLSVVGRTKLRPIVEQSGHQSPSIHSWKLDSVTLRFQLKGALPFTPELLEPQASLLRYVLKQPYSREMVYSLIDIQKKHKQRCPALEEQMVELMVAAMEECARADQEACKAREQHLNQQQQQQQGTSPTPNALTIPEQHPCSCAHLSSLLIYFVLSQLISFPCLVQGLYEKVQR